MDVSVGQLIINIEEATNYVDLADAVNAFVNHFEIFTEVEADQLVRSICCSDLY